ncbi:MAG: type III pantothenate kinase [Firmicutes bacterium]|nr:type III pantothenate kinase [Bacillota bacterium]
MILAVNIGNTNIRAAVGNPKILAQTVFYANENPIQQIETGLSSQIWEKITGSIIATVVPEQTETIVNLLKSKTTAPIKLVDTKNCGNLKTDNYSGLLGEDRAVCCSHALDIMTKNNDSRHFAVIDFGTATTINVVNPQGEFLGGAILGGLQTGINSLSLNTAQLPKITFDKSDKIPLIGTNTVDNLRSGAAIGIACAIEGFLARIKLELQTENLAVIVTGGHSPIILPHCNFTYLYEPTLLLEGLLNLYE